MLLLYDPVTQKVGILKSTHLHTQLCGIWNTLKSFKEVSDMPRFAGKSWIENRLLNDTLNVYAEFELEDVEMDSEERVEDGLDEPLFQDSKRNFGRLALALSPPANSLSKRIAKMVYGEIMASYSFVAIRKDRNFLIYDVKDVIRLLELDKSIEKDSFPVAGSIEYDADLNVLRIVGPSGDYDVALTSLSMSPAEYQAVAQMNSFDKKGKKTRWNCVYRVGIERSAGGKFVLKNVKVAVAKDAVFGPNPDPCQNRYKLLAVDGLVTI